MSTSYSIITYVNSRSSAEHARGENICYRAACNQNIWTAANTVLDKHTHKHAYDNAKTY